MILAGDVGGTKTILGVFRRVEGRLRCEREEAFATAEASSAADLLAEFLHRGHERPTVCALGVAGPVAAGQSTRIHLPWVVDEARLQRRLGLERVRVLNDVEATAWGIAELPRSKLRSLTPGVRGRPGPAGLIAAGTGLGTASMVRDGDRFLAWAGEGGHRCWGPPDAEAESLWRFLMQANGRVEVEHVVSGPGLGSIYDELVARSGGRPPRATERRLRRAEDRNAEIVEIARAGSDPTASRAFDRFVRYYGSAAGDLALALGAVAGMYVAGGIAARIADDLVERGFIEAFRDQGAVSGYAEAIPVRVVLEPRCALLGAAAFAEQAPTRPRKPSARPTTRSPN